MKKQRAFTIIELLVVVSIIALLVGILLPAISKARQQAMLTVSQGNLRNLQAALDNYAAEYADRQPTAINDNAASYGGSPAEANNQWQNQFGQAHPGLLFGRGRDENGNGFYLWGYWMDISGYDFTHLIPMTFQGPPSWAVGWGTWRFIHQTAVLHDYVNGRFYDPVYYAPKDDTVIAVVEPAFESPDELFLGTLLGASPGYSSYCMSPAAMFSPDVMRNPNKGGFQDPWDLPAGFRSPGVSQALYPALKTRMLEHHWLQNRKVDCNAGFSDGTYEGCEPYYFNHSWYSSPVTLFFDGHIASLGVQTAEQADGLMEAQSGYGLWSRDTPLGTNGYFSNYGFDFAQTSFHVLTTDGIRGRDTLGGS
jgi:prepilin-type N-terminal cleavage/methylation domain-containing protein